MRGFPGWTVPPLPRPVWGDTRLQSLTHHLRRRTGETYPLVPSVQDGTLCVTPGTFQVLGGLVSEGSSLLFGSRIAPTRLPVRVSYKNHTDSPTLSGHRFLVTSQGRDTGLPLSYKDQTHPQTLPTPDKRLIPRTAPESSSTTGIDVQPTWVVTGTEYVRRTKD